jgi:GT2 family glycosyltransferase
MTPSASAIVVNHRSAPEAAACVATLREAFAREKMEGEIVLVDCGSGEEEVRALSGLSADTNVFLPDNRGYSGGVNAGLARARSARLLIANADVVFHSGAVSALLAHIEDPRIGAAAPLCLWDADGRLRLPAESPTRFRAQLGRERFAPFARRQIALWEKGGDAEHLSGAVLAARRDVFDRVGRFDERFLFEWEETEWEERVRLAGFLLRFVPEARVRHLYARSAGRNPETERRRAVSRRLYRERRWGRLGRSILERAPQPYRDGFARSAEPGLPARAGAWAAVSTNASLVPFAGAPLDTPLRLPEEVLASLPPGPVYLRTFSAADGEPLETAVWEKR